MYYCHTAGKYNIRYREDVASMDYNRDSNNDKDDDDDDNDDDDDKTDDYSDENINL